VAGATLPQQSGDSDFVHRQSIRAKALDALRGLLPAARCPTWASTARASPTRCCCCGCVPTRYPSPALRRAHAGRVAQVIPSFLQRVDLADRGGVWSDYMTTTRQQSQDIVNDLWPDGQLVPDTAVAGVTLDDWDPEGEDKVIAASAIRT